MWDTIFKKQFFAYTGTLLIIFIIFGLSLSQGFQSYFISKKEDMLVEQGEQISALYEEAYDNGRSYGYLDFTDVENELKVLEKHMGVSYILVNGDFQVLTASKDVILNSGFLPQKIPEFEELKEGKIIKIEGTLGGLFKENFLTIGCPIVINDVVKGSIFMSSSVPEIQKSISEISRLMVILLSISIGIAFVLIYVSTRTISKPLMEMNEAAKIIAQGDFEKRLLVGSKDEVGQLANSFNSMAESLFQQEQQRKEFVSNISHDLRSPLTSVQGFLEAILDGTIPPEKQHRYLNIILDETKRLSKLANDILDINQLNMTELHWRVFDINELIRQVVIQLEHRILEKQIQLRVAFAEERTFVNADNEKINRVLYNLLDNAVKFTDLEGFIQIETSIQEGKVLVSVKDNGIGIKEEQQRNVFDRFYKVDASRGEYKEGSGLGLAIIKEFIKAHEETIVLKSSFGNGSEFVFTLSLATMEQRK